MISPRAEEQFFKPMDVAPGTKIKDFVSPDVLAMLHPIWHEYEPENPMFYFVFAIIYMVGGGFAFFGNAMVLYIFLRYNTFRTPANMLIMNLAFCDVMMMATMLPENIYCFLMGGVWQLGHVLCQLHSFCGTLFGCGQITTLVFIAFDRFNVIVRGFNAAPLTVKRVKVFLGIIWTWAFCWAIGPLVGYGSYTLDGILASCSYGYMDREETNVAYIVGIFIFCFSTPLCLIMLFYLCIVLTVFAHEKGMREQAKKMNVISLKPNEDVAKQSAEIRIARVAMINVSLWIIAWAPFAAVCMVGAVGNQTWLTPMVTAIPGLMAKTSCFYNPIVYAISHPKYRQCLKKSFPCLCIDEPGLGGKDNKSQASKETKVLQEEA